MKQDAVRTRDRSISQFPNPGQTSCAAGGCSSASLGGRIVFNEGNPLLPAGGSITVRNPR